MGATAAKQGPQVLVNLGCGLNAPEGWINVDASWSAKIAKHPWLSTCLRAVRNRPSATDWSPDITVANLTRPLPFLDGSVDVVYSSHTLEHLHVEDAKRLIKEIHRVLKQGGVLRILVPDGARVVSQGIIHELTETDYREVCPRISAKAKRTINMGMSETPERLLRRVWNRIDDLHSHKYLYTERSLVGLLRWGGFEIAERLMAYESRILEIHGIELSGRSGDGSLCVEAVR